jgi:hypothetical protein
MYGEGAAAAPAQEFGLRGEPERVAGLDKKGAGGDGPMPGIVRLIGPDRGKDSRRGIDDGPDGRLDALVRV